MSPSATSSASTCHPIAHRTFSQEGFPLYDSDEQVALVLQRAGFTPPKICVFGDSVHPGGQLALAPPAPGRQAGAKRRHTITPPITH
jgi:hypothetical protein